MAGPVFAEDRTMDLGALIVLSWIEEAAVAAAMQVHVAAGTSVQPPELLAGQQPHRFSAAMAVHHHVGHNMLKNTPDGAVDQAVGKIEPMNLNQ